MADYFATPSIILRAVEGNYDTSNWSIDRNWTMISNAQGAVEVRKNFTFTFNGSLIDLTLPITNGGGATPIYYGGNAPYSLPGDMVQMLEYNNKLYLAGYNAAGNYTSVQFYVYDLTTGIMNTYEHGADANVVSYTLAVLGNAVCWVEALNAGGAWKIKVTDVVTGQTPIYDYFFETGLTAYTYLCPIATGGVLVAHTTGITDPITVLDAHVFGTADDPSISPFQAASTGIARGGSPYVVSGLEIRPSEITLYGQIARLNNIYLKTQSSGKLVVSDVSGNVTNFLSYKGVVESLSASTGLDQFGTLITLTDGQVLHDYPGLMRGQFPFVTVPLTVGATTYTFMLLASIAEFPAVKRTLNYQMRG